MKWEVNGRCNFNASVNLIGRYHKRIMRLAPEQQFAIFDRGIPRPYFVGSPDEIVPDNDSIVWAGVVITEWYELYVEPLLQFP